MLAGIAGAAALVGGIAMPAEAQELEWSSRSWEGQDVQILFGMGERAFIDDVIDVDSGDDVALKFADPTDAIGPPDHRRTEGERGGNYLSLGCGGTATFVFTDNVLVDQPGPDVFVFEQGWNEPTNVEIRADGNWYAVGVIRGGVTGLDIGASLSPAERSLAFDAVRLTDIRTKCRDPEYNGADIDAVGAIAARPQWHIGDSNFEFDSDQLRENTRARLPYILDLLSEGQVIEIRGHTDSFGDSLYNEDLALRRARSVSHELQLLGFAPTRICLSSFGERLPIADNETPEGRTANRRVELRLLEHCPSAQ